MTCSHTSMEVSVCHSMGSPELILTVREGDILTEQTGAMKSFCMITMCEVGQLVGYINVLMANIFLVNFPHFHKEGF